MIVSSMRKQLPRVLTFVLMVMVCGSSSLMAQEEVEILDARVTGYPEKYWLVPPGTAGTWAVLAGLGIVCLGPLFLNSKRTHLD